MPSPAYDPLHHSRAARAAKAEMFRRRGHICHLCGHHGAREADLVIPRAKAPHQPIHPDAYRPAHGVRSPCPTCGRRCNQSRGAKPVEAIWRPKLDW